MSDRELYTRLWNDTLRHEVPQEAETFGAEHVDLVSTGSDEDVHAWLKYYADEETRRDWAERYPDYALPAHEELPYDRDRHMPQP